MIAWFASCKIDVLLSVETDFASAGAVHILNLSYPRTVIFSLQEILNAPRAVVKLFEDFGIQMHETITRRHVTMTGPTPKMRMPRLSRSGFL
ncbi:hypothetical protein K503DRAFT_21353 [Rhizopogon vinicolor AM-OR11-026]|uniref:Uncharacterized protein n=1 Tax=Rhizopogon vinicolor AM-OR11-026 TaxID=1314800 RepID=A0A1B7N5K7_9AGAM|nr:hypothetical protein K503DRAFT_21353 [Rhizopogon vinicolor AM-OR11-026]